MCDGRTVKRHDLVEADHVRRHYTGSTMYLMHNPQQQFYYMSKQSKNDVLIFKNFDSKKGVSAQCEYGNLHFALKSERAILTKVQMHHMRPFCIQMFRPIQYRAKVLKSVPLSSRIPRKAHPRPLATKLRGVS